MGILWSCFLISRVSSHIVGREGLSSVLQEIIIHLHQLFDINGSSFCVLSLSLLEMMIGTNLAPCAPLPFACSRCYIPYKTSRLLSNKASHIYFTRNVFRNGTLLWDIWSYRQFASQAVANGFPVMELYAGQCETIFHLCSVQCKSKSSKTSPSPLQAMNLRKEKQSPTLMIRKYMLGSHNKLINAFVTKNCGPKFQQMINSLSLNAGQRRCPWFDLMLQLPSHPVPQPRH